MASLAGIFILGVFVGMGVSLVATMFFEGTI